MINNDKEAFEKYLERLIRTANMKDASAAFHIYKEVLFGLSVTHQDILTENEPQRDMKIILQMMFTKLASLETHLFGIEFHSPLMNKNLNKIIDSTLVASAVRGMFETVGMFNTVFVQPQTVEVRLILYHLWIISGLKHRQGFNSRITLPEHQKRSETEKTKIDEYTSEIYNTNLYRLLDEASKRIITNKIKSKDYKIHIENGSVRQLSVQESINNAGLEKTMGVLYNYFSLSAHPSYVGVFQFRELFEPENPKYVEMALFNVNTAFKLISVFVADYIKVFPKLLDFFNSLPQLHRSLVQINNNYSRGEDYLIR